MDSFCTTSAPVKFDGEGKLKIMHVTDTHLDDDNIDMSLFLIEQSCIREKPHIVIITGDNVQNCDDCEKTKKYIHRLMSIFDTQGIKCAVTFGNHDSEAGAMTRKELFDCYNSYDCCVGVDTGDTFEYCGTYNIPVLSKDGSQVKFNLWVFDSGDYDKEGHYGCVEEKAVQWYREKSADLARENGGKVYSLAFQHIIVPEVYDYLKKTNKRKLYSFSHMYNKNEYYMFDPKQTNYETLNETPCCGYPNYGQFEAMAEMGDVLGIFTGHDHTNAFGVKGKGIDIVNSLSTRYNGDRFSSMYGYRMLFVDESTPDTYTTSVSRWYDMFKVSDIKKFKNDGNAIGAKTVKCLVTYGFVQKCLTKIGRTFTRVVTGRRVTY